MGSTTLAQHCPYVNILLLVVGSISSWNQYIGPTFDQCTTVTCFNMAELRWVQYVRPTFTCHIAFGWKFVENTKLTPRWANVHRRLVLTWPSSVGCIALGQHWTNIRAWDCFWIKVCWKYYVDPTLDQCTPETCFLKHDHELRWVQYVWPTSDQGMPVTLVLDKVCWKYCVDPTLDQYTPATCFKNMIWLCFMLNALRRPSIGPTTRAMLFLDESLLKTLHGPTLGLHWSKAQMKN